MKISFRNSIDTLELPIITVRYNNLNLFFLLDSGSNPNYICANVVDPHREEITLADESSFYGFDGKEYPVSVVKIPFHIGRKKYQGTFYILSTSIGFDKIEQETGVKISGIIGTRFFIKNGWVLDFSQGAVYSRHFFSYENTFRK